MIQPVKGIFRHGRIRAELLRQFGTHFRAAYHRRLKRPGIKNAQRHIDLRVTVAHTEKKLCRMTLLCIHFMRLRWGVAFNVVIRVVKCVLMILTGNPVDLFQGVHHARKLAHVDFSQHASNSWVGKVKSGQEGSLIATMVAHVGCNRGVGGLKGTNVGKHCDGLI